MKGKGWLFYLAGLAALWAIALLSGATALVSIPDGLILFPVIGAIATYGVSTSKTDINGVWRKVQAKLQVAAQFMVDEWDMLDEIQNFEVDLSAREITVPLDLADDVGIASIPEGGFEARPSSPNVVDATITWILFNGRFTISKTAKWLDQRMRRAMIERQLLFQGRKKLQAMARVVGHYFYGFSTATLAKVTSVAGAVLTIKDAYGIAGLHSTTAPFRVTDFFKVGDFVAVLNPAGPAVRGIEKVTAVTAATPSITVANAVAGAAANDLIVLANSLENDTANLSSTDRDAGYTGLLDILTSTSLHGVSSATEPKWAASTDDTAGGRFTGTKLRKLRQGINNNGGGKLDFILWSQGVENDVTAQLQAGLRFSNAFALEMDGAPKARGVTLKSTRFVPEGHVFGFQKRSLRKLTLIPKPGTPAWDDGDKLQDQSGFIFPVDYPSALISINRGNFGRFASVTEA